MCNRKSKCVLTAMLFTCAALFAQTQKNYKSREEYDMYAEVTKQFAAGNFAKAITGLDAWSAKFAESDYRDDRQLLYVQAYHGANQPAKVLEAAAPLMTSDPGKLSAADRVRLLYTATIAVQKLPDPNAEQMKIGTEAARRLQVFDTLPEGTNAADWAKARADLQATASGTLLHLALLPVAKARNANDCSGAESAAMKVLAEYPDSAQAAYFLGSAQVCLARNDPAKTSPALYAFARAAALDPVKGRVDPKWQQSTVVPYLEKIYKQYHGSDEGLKALKELAASSPLPPAGFTIKSSAQILQDQQAEMESKHPEYALWTKIKAALVASDGEQYFAASMKGAAVPALTAEVVGATPQCRAAELTLAIRPPGTSGAVPAEITLKLSKPVTGKPEIGSTLRFEGVPTEFTKEPFLLTMETEPDKITGLKTSPCGVLTTKKGVRKK